MRPRNDWCEAVGLQAPEDLRKDKEGSLWAKQPEHPLWRAWESPLSEGTGGPVQPQGQRGVTTENPGKGAARPGSRDSGTHAEAPREAEGRWFSPPRSASSGEAGHASGGVGQWRPAGRRGAGGSSEHPARCSAGWEDRGFPQRHGVGARGDGQPCTGGGVRAPPGSQPGLPGGPRRTQMCEKAQMRKMYFQTRSRAV